MNSRMWQRTLGGLIATTALLTTSTALAHAGAGDLDESFSQDGFAKVPGLPVALDVSSDGSITFAGSSVAPGAAVPSLQRLTNDGQLDEGFGEQGQVEIDFGPYVSITDVQLDSKERIVVAGGAGRRSYILRLLPTGQMDPTFNDGAPVLLDEDEHSPVIDLSPDDAIAVATAYAYDYQRVRRVLPDGSIDATFGDEGTAELPDESGSSRGVAISADGSIYVLNAGITRLTPTGGADRTYGEGGFHPLGGFSGPRLTDLHVSARGAAYLVETHCTMIGPDAGCSWGVKEVASDGSADRYIASTSVIAGIDSGQRLLTADGFGPRDEPSGIVVERALLSDGARDRGWGKDGAAVAYAGGLDAYPTAAALTPEGGVVVAGYTERYTRRDRRRKPILARFIASAGPADLDADGTRDARDRCEFGYSRANDGCRTIHPRLFLRRESGGLVLALRSRSRACRYNVRASLLKVRPGPDRVVRRTEFRHADERYPPTVAESPRPGRYYVRVAGRKLSMLRCASATSGRVRVPKERLGTAQPGALPASLLAVPP